MSTKRFLVLTLGPIILIAASYWVTFEFPHSSREAMAASTTPAWNAVPFEAKPQTDTTPAESPLIEEACNKAAARLLIRIGEQYRVFVQAPFVIAGDMPEAQLKQNYENTIEPIAHALRSSYFETPPDQPIIIMMLTSVRNYRRTAQDLDNYDAVLYHGYFLRDQRRIVLDLSSGNGTLAHELTHALLAFDFPAAPEWFDEGLASLHEQGVFSDDGLTLLGDHNWRLQSLKQAVLTGQLRPIKDLINSRSFRQEGEGLHYAQVRYLCLYLQRRGLLKTYYRQFREAADVDPNGTLTLQRVLGVNSLEAVDDDFRIWLRDEFLKMARTAG